MDTAKSLPTISTVPAVRQAAVSRKILTVSTADAAAANGLLEQIEHDPSASVGMLAARRERAVVGAVWFRELPGGLARVWPARLMPGESELIAERLQQAADRLLTSRPMHLAQALLPLEAEREARRFRDGGYTHAADLAFLVSFRPQAAASRPPIPCRLEPYRPGRDRAELLDLLGRSYEGSRDMPTLLGTRSVEAILAGYEETARRRPESWFLLRSNDRGVGCLLVADQPSQDQWELTYVGLVPDVRGRGWGLPLIRHLQWQAAQAGRARVVLAVDAANEPATRMYAAAGFCEWQRQQVFTKVFAPPPSHSACAGSK